MQTPRIILITGATSGIGQAVAEAYAAEGITLLLTGRNQERLDAVAQTCRDRGAQVETLKACVTDQSSLTHGFTAWDETFPIDIVIANAGISGGSMDKDALESIENFKNIMATNVDGVLHTIFPVLPRMRKRGYGQIVLMGSMAGFRGMPSAQAYSMSKNAVRALAEALRPLLKKDGIKVNLICPGFIRTPLTDVNTFPMPFLIEPDQAAKCILKGITKNKAVIAFPLRMRLLAQGVALLPRFLGDWILSKAPKKP